MRNFYQKKAYNFSFKDCSPVEFKGNKLDFVIQ